MKIRFILSLAAAATVLSGPHLSQAAEQELAAPEAMPYVTLLDEFTLYSSSATKPNEAIGALSSFQSVHLAPIRSDRLLGITQMEKIPVETWLGEAWINLKEGSYKYGRLDLQEQTVTLLEENTTLYDAPLNATGYGLAPQKVQAIASIDVCDPYTPCYGKDKWFLIHTSWLGDKWIRPYHYAEKYAGVPVEGMITIAEESTVYRYPADKPLTDEPKLPPQVVKPLGKYMQMARMVPPSVWYQIDTPNGPRWILASSLYGLGFEGVESVDLQIDIPVPFNYYLSPWGGTDSREQQQPQTVHATGHRDGWYFVITNGSGRWINPSKDIAARLTGDWDNDSKLGVKESNAQVKLTETSIALDKPYEDSQLVQDALTFTPQTVTASRIWKSPNGETWYYIHTWQGPKWVRP